jgi:diguanylate cyclase (GGDEF)-like protein
VNGQVVKSHRLADGDRVGLGQTVVLRFALTDENEERLQRQLYEASVYDGLTGAVNRKHFGERLEAEIAFAIRHEEPLVLVMLDLDYFKRVNDTRGHLAGDYVLREVASLVRGALRVEDVLARYGGEEFAIIARGIDTRGGLVLAERIRSLIERSPIAYGRSSIRLTLCAGVASLACCDESRSVEGLVRIADERLYRAKAAGRNRSVGA